MKQEQMDLLGGPAVPAGPPRVPAVVPHPGPRSYNCEGQELPCVHCQMNADRFLRRLPVPGWKVRQDMVILRAVVTITSVDGSTLSLCAQHAQEREEREDRDG